MAENDIQIFHSPNDETKPTRVNPARSEKQDDIIKELKGATTPTIYNITLTTANTEYSQALPTGTKIIQFRLRDETVDLRYSFTTGKVATPTAPYLTLPYGASAKEDGIYLTGKTMYFASPSANQVVELLVWN